MWHRFSALLVAGSLSLAAQGCKQERKPVPAPAKTATPPSLLQQKELNKAIDALLEPLSEPVRILTLTVLHRQVILQVQDPENFAAVIEYRYRNGKVQGPEPVTLLGSGKLKDNLFPQSAADPRMALKVLEQVESEAQGKPLKLKKLVMMRNLPRSRDIQFRVYFDSPDGEVMISADKHGRLLGQL